MSGVKDRDFEINRLILKHRISLALPRIIHRSESKIVWRYLTKLREKYAPRARWISQLRNIINRLDADRYSTDPMYMRNFHDSVESLIINLDGYDDVLEELLKFLEL